MLNDEKNMHKPVVILGAGIAGLSVAYFLKQKGIDSIVLEKKSYYGGLARSFRWNGFWCDFSAHRFFAHNRDVLDQVRTITPMIEHHRKSQIFFNGDWLRDPVDVVELLMHLPIDRSVRLALDYFGRNQHLPDNSFEHYVLKRYGTTLYELFFRNYTERLFSIPGNQIAVEWARWKVRLASPFDRLRPSTRTKFNRFYYPLSGGYGAIVNGLYQHVQNQVVLNATVTGLIRDQNGQISGVSYQANHQRLTIRADHIISTLPITITAQFFNQYLDLDYQKVDAVYLLLNKDRMSENHWLYFMDKDSTINRIVEFKNMSNHNTPPDKTVVCAEVTLPEDRLIERVIDDLVRSRLIRPEEVIDAHIVHEPFAYPRYTQGYVAKVESFLETLQAYPNVHILGRAAQFTHYEVDDLLEHAYETAKELTKMESITIQSHSQPPTVWIVVLTLNNYDDTAECLESLRKLRYPAVKIVLVDNGSTDNTPQLVRLHFPEVRVIENGYNVGVAAGYNIGIHYALDQGAEYVFVLNNDTIVDCDLIDHLVAAANEKDAGILMPVIYFYTQKTDVWSAGARYRKFPPAIVMEKRVYSDYHDLHYAISCGFLVTRRAFEKAGLFDENFRFLWDDLDFSIRVRKAGLRILQVPRARMWHKVSRTTNPASEMFWQTHGESGVIFFRRHGHPITFSPIIHLGYFALREFLLKRRLRLLPVFLRGVQSGLKKPLAAIPSPKDRLSYP